MKNTILVVDDQETTITLLTKILSPLYTVCSAQCGKDAIVFAEEHQPDIILLDILMMDMDGYAVLSELKKSDKTKNIPVIFITTLTDDAEEEKGLKMGAVDYITKPFSPAIVKLRIRNQIRILENLQTIENLSKIDQLTNLPNRRSFEEKISLEWARALRDQIPISILMIDVDFFKNYNDTYGHQQGDIALKTVANIFMETIKRPCDFAARWGGEEFTVLLPGTDSPGALEVAEKIRKCVENTEIKNSETLKTKVTVSIGVYTIAPGGKSTSASHSIDEFVSGADKALYEAKEKGRNRTCYYSELN